MSRMSYTVLEWCRMRRKARWDSNRRGKVCARLRSFGTRSRGINAGEIANQRWSDGENAMYNTGIVPNRRECEGGGSECEGKRALARDRSVRVPEGLTPVELRMRGGIVLRM